MTLLVSEGDRNTSSTQVAFILNLSIGTTIPMIIGFFLIRPVSLPPTNQASALERGMESDYT
jgi:hypothetical protein